MVKFIKPGKVVVILQGRYAGKKAVIVRNHDVGTTERPYGYAVVAGVERAPLKVTKTMGKKRLEKRTKVKPFVKIINYNHMMPTRYAYESDKSSSGAFEKLKVLTDDTLSEKPNDGDFPARENAKKAIKKEFEEFHRSGKHKWFFQKLRF